jgi:biopolymer transport protein ExbD
MRRRYQPPTKNNSTFTLNINSLTDVFTLLLVFLLQTYNTSEIQVEPAPGIRLPASTSEKNPIMGVKLSLTKEALLIDTNEIIKLEQERFKSADLDKNDTNFIPELHKKLEEINKTNPELAKTGRVLLQADKDLSYNTLRKVMYTTSMAGFPNTKLIVQLGN